MNNSEKLEELIPQLGPQQQKRARKHFALILDYFNWLDHKYDSGEWPFKREKSSELNLKHLITYLKDIRKHVDGWNEEVRKERARKAKLGL